MKNSKILFTIITIAFSVLTSGCSNSVSSTPLSLTVPHGAGTGAGGLGVGPVPVALGLAGNFAILAKSAISTVPSSAVTGNLGISPAAASFITGFSLSAPPTTYTTSTQVTGQIFASNYNPPTPANMTTAVADMGTAYTDASGRAPDQTELGAGAIGGMNLPPGTYKWSTGVLITTNLYLTGGPNDVWIFEIAGNFTMASGTRIILQGGALAKNIFWQTFGAAELGTTAHFEGILLSQTNIVLKTHASMNGRLLAQTAVTLDQNVVVQP
ncbi:MAG: ice-binding family protein [Pseudobdellovibrio sp.]